MPRRVQDIIPNDRRSIRDVPLNTESKKSETKSDKETHIPVHIKTEKKEPISSHRIDFTPTVNQKKLAKKGNGGRWLLITLAIAVVAAGLGYVATVYFSRATITIVPHILPVKIDNIYLAQSVDNGKNIASSTLTYEIVTVHEIASTTVAASAGKSVSTKAQGPVKLYNAFSVQPQRLVAGTRFTSDGTKIYRLVSSTVIPGLTYASDKTTVLPGSISATIIAEQAGDSYNITGAGSVADMKIVAYKGTSRHDTMYARPTAEITGGFVGTQKVVAPALLASTTSDLHMKLLLSLLKQAHDEVRYGYIMFDEGYVTYFSASHVLAANTASDNTAQISIDGTMNGIIFNKKSLIAKLVGSSGIATFGGFDFSTTGLEKLNVSLVGLKVASTSFAQSKDPVSIRVSGDLKLVANIPVDEIKKKLAGASISDIPNLLKPYQSIIDKVSAELMPPWSKISLDPNRISVVINNN